MQVFQLAVADIWLTKLTNNAQLLAKMIIIMLQVYHLFSVMGPEKQKQMNRFLITYFSSKVMWKEWV